MSKDLSFVAIQMINEGLSETFVLRALSLARESEGVEDMLYLWRDEPGERPAIEAEIQAAIEDREPAGSAVEIQDGPAADRLIGERLRQKEHIRALVAAHGGVSRVAEAAGIPQPSLSRFLNTPSEPRPATLHRLAVAMGLTVADLSVQPGGTDALHRAGSGQAISPYVARPTYGTVSVERRLKPRQTPSTRQAARRSARVHR